MAGKPAFPAATTEGTAIAAGDKVTVRFADGAVHVFTIVERNGIPEAGTVSSASPLGKALLGKHGGDDARYRVGEKEFSIRIVTIIS